MTDFAIAAAVPRVQYIASGTQTSFTVPFPLFATADLAVWLNDAASSSGFTVAGIGNATATLTFATAPAAGTRVTLLRAMPLGRATDFQEAGEFRAAALNEELDRLAMLVQQVDEKAGRAVRQKASDLAGAALDLPTPAAGYLRWNDAGTALVLDPVPQAVATAAAASAAAAAGSATAAASSAGSAAGSATSAAGSATAAASSSAAAAASATAASASVTSAAGSAAAASASATAAAASAAAYPDERKRIDLAALRERVRLLIGNTAQAQLALGLDFVQGRGLDWLSFGNASGGRSWFDERGVMQTAAANVARYDHAPLTGTARGLLLEEGRANDFWPSEDFSHARWTKDVGTSIAANAASGLDGAATAQRVDFNDLAGGVRQDVTVANDSVTRIVSWLVKAGTVSTVQLRNVLMGGTVVMQDVSFDLAAGTCTATGAGIPAPASSFGMVALGGGWWRVHAAIANNASGNTTQRSFIWGTTTGTFFLDGAQNEVGLFATSYIKTVSASVARAADVAALSPLVPWSGTEGSIVAEYSIAAPVLAAAGACIVALGDATADNVVQLSRAAATGYGQAVVVNASVTQAALNIATAQASDTVHKAALAFRADDVALLQNGGAPQTDTSAAIPTFTACLLGRAPGGGQALNGYLRTLLFFPRRLATSPLQTLTA